jgi:hypothetical protein
LHREIEIAEDAQALAHAAAATPEDRDLTDADRLGSEQASAEEVGHDRLRGKQLHVRCDGGLHQ